MKRHSCIAAAVLAVLCVGLWLAPSARPLADDGGRSVRARVVSVDDSDLTATGLLEYGTQHLEVELLDGPAAGPSSSFTSRCCVPYSRSPVIVRSLSSTETTRARTERPPSSASGRAEGASHRPTQRTASTAVAM